MEEGFDPPWRSSAPPDEAGLFAEEPGAGNVPAPSDADDPGEETAPVGRYSLFEQVRRGARFGRLGIVLAPGMLYEVVESVNITPLPGVKPLFKGFVTHRSNVVPVYDLAGLIDGECLHWERKRLLILNSGREAVAVLLYELPFQIRGETPAGPERIDAVPEILRRHTREVWRSRETLWLAPDYEGLFTELSTLCLHTAPQTQAPGPAGAEPSTSTLEY